jgi:antitoxin ParD1/3/4
MADHELVRWTVTVAEEMAEAVKTAVEAGEYVSTSEVVRDALRDWQQKRHIKKLNALRADIALAEEDVAKGRVSHYDRDEILAGGRKLLAARSRSA